MGRDDHAADGAVITLHEAAERLGVHYMTAYKYVRSGRLPAVKEAGEWRVRLDDLDAFRSPEPAVRGDRRRARDGFEARLIAGDEAGAWSIVEATMASGADAEEILLRLVSPSLRSIGDRWAAGELSVADEHRASAVAQRIIARIGPRFTHRGRRRGEVLVGAVAGERHSIPCAILADVLRGARFEVVDLGADTPPASFAAAAVELPRLVGVAVSVTSEDNLASVAPTLAALRRAVPDVPVLVGGGAVRDAAHAAELGSSAYAADARQVADLFGGLLDGSVSLAG
jgi:excisionase family DNA binding protein